MFIGSCECLLLRVPVRGREGERLVSADCGV